MWQGCFEEQTHSRCPGVIKLPEKTCHLGFHGFQACLVVHSFYTLTSSNMILSGFVFQTIEYWDCPVRWRTWINMKLEKTPDNFEAVPIILGVFPWLSQLSRAARRNATRGPEEQRRRLRPSEGFIRNYPMIWVVEVWTPEEETFRK